MRPVFLLCLTLGGGGLLLNEGCSRAAMETRQANRDRASLALVVDTYWDAVRWGDAPRAAGCLKSPEAQLALVRVLATPRYRLNAVSVMQVVVGAARSLQDGTEEREGTALVKVDAIEEARARLVTETVEQHWLKTSSGWHLDESKLELVDGRPW